MTSARSLGWLGALLVGACTTARAPVGEEEPESPADAASTPGPKDAAPSGVDAQTLPADAAPRDLSDVTTDGAVGPADTREADAVRGDAMATLLAEIAYPEHVARTMSRLASSTAAAPQDVRILAFGQSISDSNARWWPMVRDALKARYPTVRLTMETRGEGGCSARCLLGETPDRMGRRIDYVRTRAIPFKPDLTIFHVYGNEQSYEQIIGLLREAGSEVLLQSDHVTWRPSEGAPFPQGSREASMAKYQADVQRNTVWMYQMALRRTAAVAPVWQEWGKYLDANRLRGRELTSDGLHPNDRGWTLIAQIIQRALFAAQRP